MPRLTLSLLIACCLLSACQNKDQNTAPAASASAPADSAASKPQGDRNGRAQTVTTTFSRIENVPLQLEAQGNVLALDEVDIRPQKNGMITAIHFQEGQEVRRGQLLFSLDARDDDANVGKAAAGVTSAEAGLSIAERDLARAQEMSDKQYISPSALDSSRSKVDTARANLAQARAALEQAKVGQSHTRILAPFDGRAGVINVRPGSLVTSSSTATALVRLTRMDPIGVSFSISERDLPPLLEALRRGPVKLSARTNAGATLQGEVSFIDSAIDRTAGTLLIKGRLDNKARLVWPGQFLTVQLAAGVLENAVVLPAQAVVNGPNGRFVYVVQEDQTVRAQSVELLRIVDQRAVIRGLDGKLKVVLEGTQNLRPGARVQEARSGKAEAGKKTPRDNQSTPAATKAGAQ